MSEQFLENISQEIQIAFSKGWNSVTASPLPPKQTIDFYLESTKNPQDAFDIGVELARKWYDEMT